MQASIFGYTRTIHSYHSIKYRMNEHLANTKQNNPTHNKNHHRSSKKQKIRKMSKVCPLWGLRGLAWLLICTFLCIIVMGEGEKLTPSWIVNTPSWFTNHSHSVGHMHNAHNDGTLLPHVHRFVEVGLSRLDGYVDGENVDALEHFFWGFTDGVAMELGALDGSRDSRSMTVDFEEHLGWRRVLIEGNPKYRSALPKTSPLSLSVSAAICETAGKVHFANADFVGGIVEFMDTKFLQSFHGSIYNAGNPPGNLSAVNWGLFGHVSEIDCIPLSEILHEAHIKHINFFILDVEGGELSVLHSIPWSVVKFDVLCVEVDPPNRPAGYADKVTNFLADKGYVNATGVVGRNICKHNVSHMRSM
ncbi:FkbM family methyltransferase [archaeon]|nr:MAG: FkbM family methyltransferase [archaeon]